METVKTFIRYDCLQYLFKIDIYNEEDSTDSDLD